jgi:hypothetical protein
MQRHFLSSRIERECPLWWLDRGFVQRLQCRNLSGREQLRLLLQNMHNILFLDHHIPQWVLYKNDDAYMRSLQLQPILLLWILHREECVHVQQRLDWLDLQFPLLQQ